jgi:transcriptional regulator of acetoin/glycerol metabolism
MSDSPNDEDTLSLDEIRRRHVTKVLEACGGNRTSAAQVLNIDRKTLYRKLLRWGLASRP